MSGSRRSMTQQSNARSLQHVERLGAGADRGDLDVVVRQQFDDACALDVVVFDDEQPLLVRRDVSTGCGRTRARDRSVVAGFTRYENAPCDSPCCRSSSTDSICTGMCRVAGSSFRLFSTVQPSMSGRNTSSVMAVGRILPRERQGRLAAVGDDALEPVVAREAEQHARVVRVVVHDEQHCRPRAIVVAVVGDDLLGRRDGSAGSAACVGIAVGAIAPAPSTAAPGRCR